MQNNTCNSVHKPPVITRICNKVKQITALSLKKADSNSSQESMSFSVIKKIYKNLSTFKNYFWIKKQLNNFCLVILNTLDCEKNSITNNNQVFITNWVDFSNRYGFGYRLSDGKVCVLFNDGKHLSLLPNSK